jgi:hypothetical protein
MTIVSATFTLPWCEVLQCFDCLSCYTPAHEADALALIRSEVENELDSLLNTDERVRSLRAEFESLKTTERTMTVLERMKEIILLLRTLHHAYQFDKGRRA